MALRLILVGVVASLALDLPRGGTRSAVSSPFVVEFRLPGGQTVPSKPSPFETSNALASLTIVRNKMAAMTVTVADPILPGRAEAVLASDTATLEIAPNIAEVIAAPVPIPTPAPEFVGAFLNDPAPVETLTVSIPMPLPSVFEELLASEPETAAAIAYLSKLSTDPDAGFKHAMSNVVAVFAADLATPTNVNEPRALLANVEPAPAPAVEESIVADSRSLPWSAFGLDVTPEPLNPIAELPPVVFAAAKVEPMPEPAALEIVAEPAPVPVVEASTADDSRAERLATAVKLTGQAVNAWAGLLNRKPSVSMMQR